MCGALYWKPKDDPDSASNIAYDLMTKSFVHLHSLDDPPLSQIPIRYLAQPADFFRRVSALNDDELRARADGLFNRMQDYMVAAVTLADMPINDLAPIFERINSTATPLTIVDLMRAATWDPQFDLRDSIDEVLAELAVRDFGTIDRKTVLRGVAASAGFGFAVEDIDKLRTKTPEQLSAIIQDVAEGAKRAVDFLTTHIKAPKPEALPYANQFPVLSEIFRRIPTPPSDEQFTAIEKWFWRTTLSGYFSGWNTGEMSRDYAAVGAFASSSPVQQIDVPAALPRDEIWRLTQFRSNSAVSKMYALMASYQDPLDLLTGQRIDARKSLAWSNDKEYHHFFPRDFLKSRKEPPGRANAVANIVLLSSASNIRISNKAPSVYLGELIEDIGRPEVVRRLGTLLVSEDALDAALADDYPTFLTIRAATLHQTALNLVGEDASAATVPATVATGEVFVGDAVDVEDEPPAEV